MKPGREMGRISIGKYTEVRQIQLLYSSTSNRYASSLTTQLKYQIPDSDM